MQQQKQEQKRDGAENAGNMGTRMNQRPDHTHSHGPATPSLASANSPREAVTVTLTAGSEAHTHHHRYHHHHHHQDPSTSSHGAATATEVKQQQQQRHGHVSAAKGASNTSTSPDSSAPGATTAPPTASLTPAATTAVNTTVNVDMMPATSTAAAEAESYEQQHVHSVYESIAPHFSATRHKPWPLVAAFLSGQARGSVGLDVGCGNGKYLDVNRDVFVMGSDRSAALAALARGLKVVGAGEGVNGEDKGTEMERRGGTSCADVVGVADGLDLPFGGGAARGRRVDFAICVAVIHHLSTRERRIDGVRALLDCVHPGTGKVLVYVWALEQGTSRRGWDEGTADQDQLVPWVMKQNKKKKKKLNNEEVGEKSDGDGGGGAGAGAGIGEAPDTTYQRYYHLYRKGELEEDVVSAGGEIIGSGYEKDNWWVIARPKEFSSIMPSSTVISR
ncbi:S-adenosyl-L-methionine-dependent methyltransferase [Hypoxylon sp. NC1633]|nr:S-adenosyl-L-methionine-dependent methyltransferase [Hypoxylon sp. NC1633]